MRGYCGIGIYHTKNEVNVGGLWRSAFCLGAGFTFTIGRRYKKQASDTPKSFRHIPLWHFDNYDDFLKHIPLECPIVGVEICDRAQNLSTFSHPERAIYLLGPEDGSIPNNILEKCMSVVKIDTEACLNVSTAGSIVLYDRRAKGWW